MNKHMYILADGGRIAASDPSEFVRVLREGSWFDSECTGLRSPLLYYCDPRRP